jgi:hypothetical protein
MPANRSGWDACGWCNASVDRFQTADDLATERGEQHFVSPPAFGPVIYSISLFNHFDGHAASWRLRLSSLMFEF